MSNWGSDLGLEVLKGLSKLYTSLVWESTVLLAFCSEDILPQDTEFGKADLETLLKNRDIKLDKKDMKSEDIESPSVPKVNELKHSQAEMGSNGVSAAMETLSTSENLPAMETEEAGQSQPALSASPAVDSPAAAAESNSLSDSSKEGKENVTDDKKKSKLSPAMQVINLSLPICCVILDVLFHLCSHDDIEKRTH